MHVVDFNIRVVGRSPQLFRYMNKEFVESFLSDGKLRLSSFEKFRNESHEQRGDHHDGKIQLASHYKNGFSSVWLTEPGMAYVLCVSSHASQGLMKQFEANDCFVIADPWLFAFQISKCIPGCNGIFWGPCTYSPSPTKYFPEIDLSNASTPTKEQAENFVKQTSGLDYLFHKNIRYRHQFEYRFVFQKNAVVSDYLDVVSPDAAKLCMRADNVHLLAGSNVPIDIS